MKQYCDLCQREAMSLLLPNIVEHGRSYSVFICNNCKVGKTVPTPTIEELNNLYASGIYRSSGGKKFRLLFELIVYSFRNRRMKKLGKYSQKGNILDIGCGRGLFLHILKKAGWNVTGVEYDKNTASLASSAYDITVITKEDLKSLPDGHFDVITLNHVLEHSLEPIYLINECKRLLRTGGVIAIAVPNISSLQALFGKNSWFHLDIPHHIYHFTKTGLQNILKHNSFKLLGISHFSLEYNPYGWLQTIYNKMGLRKNLLFKLIKRRELPDTNASKKVPVASIAAVFILLPLLGPVSLILSFVESYILRQGGTIEFFAMKK